MSKNLESPYVGGVPDWDALYRARADEVSGTRPIFTGDVFTGVRLPGSTGNTKARTVVILQHPCSMRTNGVDLTWQVLVAAVSNRKEIDEPGWVGGNYNLMPLPELRPEATSQARHQAADFDNLYTVPRAEATACMDWLRADRDGSSYQEMLRNPQSHNVIRRAMRAELKERNQW